MNHAQLVKEILDRADTHTVWCWPTPPSTARMVGGWVDIVALGSRGALFIEAKAEDGRRTRKQVDVANRLTRASLAYRLWRPSDIEAGTVDADLEAIA